MVVMITKYECINVTGDTLVCSWAGYKTDDADFIYMGY